MPRGKPNKCVTFENMCIIWTEELIPMHSSCVHLASHRLWLRTKMCAYYLHVGICVTHFGAERMDTETHAQGEKICKFRMPFSHPGQTGSQLYLPSPLCSTWKSQKTLHFLRLRLGWVPRESIQPVWYPQSKEKTLLYSLRVMYGYCVLVSVARST